MVKDAESFQLSQDVFIKFLAPDLGKKFLVALLPSILELCSKVMSIPS